MVKCGDIGRWRRSFLTQNSSLEILCSAGEIDFIVAMHDAWGTLNKDQHDLRVKLIQTILNDIPFGDVDALL